MSHLSCDRAWFENEAATAASTCKFINIEAKNTWINTNEGFVYSLKNESSVQITCKNATIDIHIHKMGLLQIDQNCILKWNNETIKNSNELYVTNKIRFKPIKLNSVNVSEHFQKIEEIGHSIRLTELENKIEDLKREEDSFSMHNLHHYSSPYLLVGVGLFILYVI